MDSDGTQDARGTHANPVPRPAGPPDGPSVPPRPGRAPRPVEQGASRSAPGPASVAEWLNEPRPDAEPGIWRYGYRLPKGAQTAERLSPVTVVGLLVPLVVGLFLWSLWRRGAMPYESVPLKLFTPEDWWWGGTVSPKGWEGQSAGLVYNGAFFLVLLYAMGRLGSWPDIARHFVGRRAQPSRALLAALGALLTLSFVFPNAFPGVGWDALPFADAVFSLVQLILDDVAPPESLTISVYAVLTLLVVWPFARIGGWWAYAKERLAARRAAAGPTGPAPADRPREQWPDLREAGQYEAAELLTAEVAAGRMNDVDCARVEHAWALARRDGSLAGFRDTVLRQGAAAWGHPSGARDLTRRTARHDLAAGQVRIGRWAAAERAPLVYHGAGAALGAEVLGTSLLAVGPSGAGKTRHLVEPVTEALALRALTGQCAFVTVSAPGTTLVADTAFDVVVRIGDRSSVHDLDPYADSEDPDEAASFLAEALVGDLDTVGTEGAATALAQVLGPYRAAHGHFPPLPVLRELLESDPAALSALREALAGDEHAVMRRELDVRIRQSASPTDVGRTLADRLALLNRPVFDGFFGGGGTARPFSLRSLAQYPLRVRVDLPEHGHEEAARLITRLVLAQFSAVVRDGRRPHFACLVLDDATGTVTAGSVRRIQRMRTQNAGVVLALRTIGDVPEALHGPLYGAVGCRMAFSGVTTWDGSRFAQAWGTAWVETRDVAKHTVFADQPMTRAIHALRKLVTGKAVTTDAVTVRTVERERWSASELAHEVPPGHAVLSLTTVEGQHAPPLLVNLRG
ncbi:ATP/GTP-binding protein [Streptomyces sp. WI04-05B]|uniref:ATP/GTP-binding protein n=1 Tax=Streptomyces TaxID=1883 RepID=UPI0029AD5C9A|nr:MULTISPECIES: ATP/GTP-binding protein [unclassified Streptomyces]MDX2541999.1 ATP/GTP-binding protein [Streptomyces sp. WI04-05B]MDX2587081.1 ATP/GTP-binding protein [Streptomyces sp. WI04-05A]